ncbi:MAG: SRPBCC family protein [Hyphomicrobiaceae bacterium]|nr:SRPBCC family protein [Hyphomicrobiaceae bacterium]
MMMHGHGGFRGACLGVAALLASAVLPAQAHGPTRQKVTETIEIKAPADKVWAKIGSFQDMSWHPAVAKTEGTGGNTDGATRTLTLGGGGVIKEKLLKYDAAGKSFKYEITEVDVKVLPINNYSSTLSVEGDGTKATVTWRGAFYRGFMNNDPPADLNDEAAVAAVKGVYTAGLQALKKALEAGG